MGANIPQANLAAGAAETTFILSKTQLTCLAARASRVQASADRVQIDLTALCQN